MRVMAGRCRGRPLTDGLNSQQTRLCPPQCGLLDGIGQGRGRDPGAASRPKAVNRIDHGLLTVRMMFPASVPAGQPLLQHAERLAVESRDVEPSVSIESHHVIGDLLNRGRDVIHELNENIRRAYPLAGKLGERMRCGLGEHRMELAGRQVMQTIVLVDENHSRGQRHAGMLFDSEGTLHDMTLVTAFTGSSD